MLQKLNEKRDSESRKLNQVQGRSEPEEACGALLPLQCGRQGQLGSRGPDSGGMARTGEHPRKQARAAVWRIETEGWDSRRAMEIEDPGIHRRKENMQGNKQVAWAGEN